MIGDFAGRSMPRRRRAAQLCDASRFLQLSQNRHKRGKAKAGFSRGCDRRLIVAIKAEAQGYALLEGPMRLFMDTIVALLLSAILLGMVWHNQNSRAEQAERNFARAEVQRFNQQIALQAALAQVHNNERGYPQEIDLNWFQGNLPANPLLPAGHPWLEIAGPDQKDLEHPPQRIANAKHLAKIWYNPHNGIGRARVPVMVSDAASLKLYNYINDCELPTLFAEPARS